MKPSTSIDLQSAKSLAELRAAAVDLDLGELADEPISRWTGSTNASPRTVDLIQRLVSKGLCSTVADLVYSEEVHKKLFQTGGRRAEKSLVQDLQEWLLAAMAEGRPGVELAEAPGESSGAPILRPGISENQLEEWAKSHRIQRWLDNPVSSLGERLARRTDTWLWQHDAEEQTLRSILTAPTAASAYWPQRGAVPKAVQESVIQLLLDKAGLVRAGQTEERHREQALERPQRNPALLDLWERLVEARCHLVERCPPLPKQERGRSSLHFEISPARVIYIEENSAWCSTRGESRIEINPKAEDPALVARCGCEEHERFRCSLCISALDALLYQFGDLSEGSLASQLVEILDQPHWSRALEDFDQVLRAALPGRSSKALDYELGWRIRVGDEPRYTIEPVEVRPRLSGEGVKTRKADLATLRAQPELCSLPVDRRVAELLLPDPEQGSTQHRGLSDTEAVHRALDLLVGHPRVFHGSRGSDRPISVRRSELALHWNELDDGAITIETTIDEEPMAPDKLAAAAREGVRGGCLVELEAEPGVMRVTPIQPGVVGILSVLERRGNTFAVDAGSELLERLHAFSRLLPVLLSESLRGIEMKADSRPLVQLELLPDGELKISIRVEPLAGVEAWFPARGPRELYGDSLTGRVFCRRDFAAEEQLAGEILAYLPNPDPFDRGQYDRTLHDPDSALDFLEQLQAEPTSVKVQWSDFGRRRVRRTASMSSLSMKLSGMEHWLGLDGTLEVEDLKVPASELMESIWAGRRHVRVGESGWIRLDDDLIEKLSALSRLISRRGDELGVSKLQSLELLRLEEEGLNLKASVPWRMLADRIRRASETNIEVPTELQETLRSYQKDGFCWLSRLALWAPGACLADDMGLGKTIQALSLLLQRRETGPALVVAPTSVGFNWMREAERFTPELRARMYRGSSRAELLKELKAGDLLITSYALAARDQEVLAEQSFATLILDEAQAIKNPDTRRARAIHSLKAEFTVVLTGTPIENRIADLWSIFAAATPGLLGTREQFRKHFVLPPQRHPGSTRVTREALARSIRPFLLRRTKEEVAPELPPRTSTVLHVSLSLAERKLYNEMRSAAVAGLRNQAAEDNGEVRRFQVLAALTRLRQLACHPRLVDPASTLTSSKLLMLRGLLHELEEQGHRALVFSQFTSHLELAREMLDGVGISYRYLDGSLSEPRRRMEVDAFQAGEGSVFLISLRAGGTGLNLTGASYVIHLDPWWNPAVEDQAADRAHRIGQTQPVTIYRLVAKDTIEEAIVSLQEKKRELIASMLDGSHQSAAMSLDELLELLSSHPPLAMDDSEPIDLMESEDADAW